MYTNRFLTLIVAAMLSMAVMAQGHKKFQGIPLNGSLAAFTQKMSQKGFRLVRKNTSYCYDYRGTYLGKERRLAAYANYRGQVYKVKIVLPDYNFDALLQGYIDLYQRQNKGYYEWEGPIESYTFVSDEGDVNLYYENGITYLEFVDNQNNLEDD